MKTLSKETLMVSLYAIKHSRYILLQEKNLPAVQERLNELNEATQEIFKAIYPVVTMTQVAEKLKKCPNKQFAIQYSTTTRYEVNWIMENGQNHYSVNYNDNQSTSYESTQEFYVSHNQGDFTTLVPVEHWYGNL